MKNATLIFENSLINADKNELENLLEDLSFNLAFKELSKAKQKKDEVLATLLNEFLNVLKKLDLLEDENCIKIIRALIKASISEAQNKLYVYMHEAELLNKQIENQKILIKNQISEHFINFENIIQNSSYKENIKQSLNDAILFDIEMLGILKETAESAFLTTLEKAEDIELTSKEIAKNLVYNAICESDFEKERILKISSIILNTAFEIANESIIFAKELCFGVIKGVEEGISLAMKRIKNSSTHAVLEEDISLKNKELIGIEDEFIALLKDEVRFQKNPSKDIVEKLLKGELDNVFAKFKRLANETREHFVLALNELKKNQKISDINELTQKKLSQIKQEILELEKIAGEKYKDLNSKKAKKLGFRLWEKAKSLVKKP